MIRVAVAPLPFVPVRWRVLSPGPSQDESEAMTTTVLCACGKGVLAIEVTLFGTWRVDELLTACPACGSGDIQKAARPPLPTQRAT